MKIFLALMACANHEHQLGRTDVEAQDVACGAKWDDEFPQRRPGPYLAVAVRRRRQVAQCSLSNNRDRLVGQVELFKRFSTV